MKSTYVSRFSPACLSRSKIMRKLPTQQGEDPFYYCLVTCARCLFCEPVKVRCVIHEQLSLALLADVCSLQEDIDRAVEAVSVRDIRAVNPALVAELFDGERQQFLIDLEAEVNPSAPMLARVTSVKINSCPRPGKAAIFFNPLHQRGYPGATGCQSNVRARCHVRARCQAFILHYCSCLANRDSLFWSRSAAYAE